MKRKLSLLAIVVALILVLTMIFVACGKKDDDANTSGGSSITADYNYQQIASRVTELANANGLFVKLHMSSTNNGQTDTYDVALGVHGQVYYVLSYGDEVYLDLTSDQYYDVYTPYNGTWRKVRTNYSEQVTKESLVTTYSAMVYGYFGMYQYLTSYEGVKTTATVAGRSCDKYTFTQTAYGATASSEVCIDKATGICLKWAAAGSYQGDSGAVTFECTQFDTSYTATLPQDGQAVTPSGGEQGGSGEGGQQGGQGEGGQQGGQGEGGQQGESGEGGQQGEGGQGEEQGTESAFVGKRFEISGIDINDAEVNRFFAGAYLDIYTDGTYEMVCSSGVIFGDYYVLESSIISTVSLQPIVIYDSVNQKYVYDGRSPFTTSLDLNDGVYTMDIDGFQTTDDYLDFTLTLVVSTSSPLKADVPTDPNGYVKEGELDGYQVEQLTWDNWFINNDYITENFTLTAVVPHPLGGSTIRVVYEFDGGYIRILYENGDEDYFSITDINYDNGSLRYIYYVKSGTDVRKFEETGNIHIDRFDWETGILPIPFLKTTYDSTSHCYSANLVKVKDQFNDEEHEPQNVKVYFEDDCVKKITYEEANKSYEFTFTNHDDTVVDLPDVD